MPELPEVEVVKKSLESKVKNLIIKKVVIINERLRYQLKVSDFVKIQNKKIISIQRRSKYLLINLSQGYTILAHLGMTGKFFIINEKNIKFKTSFYYKLKKNDTKHDHIIFFLNKKVRLIYNDVRKFGFIKIIKSSSICKNSHLKNLGPEPLSRSFNISYFNNYILGKKNQIKDLLMNQKFVAGLGNIYCNELLFLSHIKPTRLVKNLKIKEKLKLLKNTKRILLKSIKNGGASIKNFSSTDGINGKFQEMFSVYGRERYRCKQKNCSGVIKKTYISKRSSFFCPMCQI